MAKKGATGDFFYSFLQKKKISQKMDNILMEKKKWKKKKLRPTGFNFSNPLYRKQNFFYGQPNDLNLNPLTLVHAWGCVSLKPN